VFGAAIEDASHHDDGTGRGDFITKDLGAIRQREDRFGGIEADLTAINVEGGDHFDVLRLVRSNPPVHQAHIGAIAGRTTVKVNTLKERAEAIPHAYNRDSDFVHYRKTLKLAVAARPGQESCHNIAIFEERKSRNGPGRKNSEAGSR
jgi:hypothetical protein